MIRYSAIGFDPDDVAETEADHFGNCPGPYLDVRDLAQMLAHVHDAEIEIRKERHLYEIHTAPQGELIKAVVQGLCHKLSDAIVQRAIDY